MRKVIAVIGFAGIFAVSGTAMAQYSAGSQEVGLVIGGAIPITKTDLTGFGGKNEAAVKTGVDFGGRYLYHTSPEWAFGGEVSYAGYGDKEHTIINAMLKMSASALDVEGVAKYTFTPGKKTRPYLIGGVGYGSLKQKTQIKPVDITWGDIIPGDTATTEYRTDYDETIGGVAFSVGAGVESSLSDTITLGIEGRLKYLGTNKTVVGKVFKWDLSNTSSVLLTAGLNWKFGK